MIRLSLKTIAAGILILLFSVSICAQKKKPKPAKPKPAATPAASTSGPTVDEISFGLKDAIQNGITHAINELSKIGGFYDNPRVKIPMPKQLQPVEKTLRFLKQDDLVDDFIHAMNRAAEQSMTEGINVFADAVRQMTIADAKNILTGPDDAATQYFRRTTETKLRERFLPIVRTGTSEAGVTSQYKEIMKKGGGVTALLGQKNFDIDEYVTEKALDGLFLMIADEEKRIRQDPLARTTSILKKVFGSIIK